MGLKACEVVVLTEKQMADVSGRLHDTGTRNPYARAFADQFSEAYRSAACYERVYADLQNLFRLRALLEGMHLRGALRKANLDLPYLLKVYSCRFADDPPGTLPGLAKAPHVEGSVARGNAVRQYVFTTVVCGGVNMQIRVTETSFSRDASARLARLRLASLHARPHRDALFWAAP